MVSQAPTCLLSLLLLCHFALHIWVETPLLYLLPVRRECGITQILIDTLSGQTQFCYAVDCVCLGA